MDEAMNDRHRSLKFVTIVQTFDVAIRPTAAAAAAAAVAESPRLWKCPMKMAPQRNDRRNIIRQSLERLPPSTSRQRLLAVVTTA
jgi:hypothetical protein